MPPRGRTTSPWWQLKLNDPYQVFYEVTLQLEEDDGEGGRSILERLRKRICLGRERHMEVGFSEILLQGVFFFYLAPLSHLQFSSQGTAATVSSTIEDYLRLPLEQYKCLSKDPNFV